MLKANGAKIAAEYAFKAKQYILVYFAHAASGGFTQVLKEFYEVSSVKISRPSGPLLFYDRFTNFRLSKTRELWSFLSQVTELQKK